MLMVNPVERVVVAQFLDLERHMSNLDQSHDIASRGSNEKDLSGVPIGDRLDRVIT